MTMLDIDKQVEELIEFLVLEEDEPHCEINHRHSKCVDRVVARRRFKCVSEGYNMCVVAKATTEYAMRNRARPCPCGANIADCWVIIDI